MASSDTKEPFYFWPRGYVLDKEYDKLHEYFDEKGNYPLILKPSLMARGDGIKCITQLDQLQKDDPYITSQVVLAQEYAP